MQITNDIKALGVDAFLGVCLNVHEDSGLAYLVSEDEERMEPIESAIVEADGLERKYLEEAQSKGVTDVVVIRGW